MTASQPRIAVAIASWSESVPLMSSQPASARSSAFAGSRTSAHDVVAALAQLAHDVAADEAGSPGDEDLHPGRAYPVKRGG